MDNPSPGTSPTLGQDTPVASQRGGDSGGTGELHIVRSDRFRRRLTFGKNSGPGGSEPRERLAARGVLYSNRSGRPFLALPLTAVREKTSGPEGI